MRRAVRWMFEDRKTGRLVLAQWPNLPLWIYIVGTILRFHLIATLGLVLWAGLEVFAGVNPFRRGLGAVVILGLIF